MLKNQTPRNQAHRQIALATHYALYFPPTCDTKKETVHVPSYHMFTVLAWRIECKVIDPSWARERGIFGTYVIHAGVGLHPIKGDDLPVLFIHGDFGVSERTVCSIHSSDQHARRDFFGGVCCGEGSACVLLPIRSRMTLLATKRFIC